MTTTDAMPLTGAITPPNANGEVVFDAPWQGRVFGMARALCEQGVYDWDEFRACLIQEIGSVGGDDKPYFEHFMNALTRLLEQKSLAAADEVRHKTDEFLARPHGHDH